MRSILFINRVYPPVEGATGQLLADLAPALVRAGWHVTVLTAAPARGAFREETPDGVRLVRVSGLPFTRASHWRRALAYLSLYPALFWRACRLPRPDIVVTLTDPPLLVVVGAAVTALRRTRHVHWAQDLYPELAEELGVLPRGGWMAGLLRRLSTQALRGCDRVIAVGRCMRDRLLQRGLDPGRTAVVPNWGHGAWPGLPGDPEMNPFRQAHGLTGRFVVMYSGNFGMAHPFGSILEAATRLQASHPQAIFVLVGDGPRRSWLRDEVAARGLANVLFLPYQPRETLAQSLGAADLHLATMEDNLCGLVVPSKVAGVVSAGRPCLFIGPRESEAARLLLEHEIGEVLPQPDGLALAGRLAAWMEHPDRRARTCARAAAAASAVGLPAAVDGFEHIFRQVLAGSTPARTEATDRAPGAALPAPHRLAATQSPGLPTVAYDESAKTG